MVNTTQHSSDWLIVPTTANQITGIEKPNYHKILIFFPTTSLKRSHEARIDELADSNEPATRIKMILTILYKIPRSNEDEYHLGLRMSLWPVIGQKYPWNYVMHRQSFHILLRLYAKLFSKVMFSLMNIYKGKMRKY